MEEVVSQCLTKEREENNGTFTTKQWERVCPRLGRKGNRVVEVRVRRFGLFVNYQTIYCMWESQIKTPQTTTKNEEWYVR